MELVDVPGEISSAVGRTSAKTTHKLVLNVILIWCNKNIFPNRQKSEQSRNLNDNKKTIKTVKAVEALHFPGEDFRSESGLICRCLILQ